MPAMSAPDHRANDESIPFLNSLFAIRHSTSSYPPPPKEVGHPPPARYVKIAEDGLSRGWPGRRGRRRAGPRGGAVCW